MKSQNQYYVSKNGEPKGPYTLDQVYQKVSNQEHSWIDYVYDDTSAQWVLMIEHPVLNKKYNEMNAMPKPPPPQVKEAPTAGDNYKDKEWYVLKEGKNYGPFSQIDLIQMLQTKTLFEFDYVWNQKFNSWRTVAEVPEFAPSNIKALKDSGHHDINEVFFRRRHARANYGCSLIVHNNKLVFKGRSLEISQGGAGIVIDEVDFVPGQTLYLHFKPSDGVPAFNAICSVVSKKTIKSKNGNQYMYGVKFTSVPNVVKEKIKEYTEQKKAS
ncbi:MAG: GYF domain-containing protein [Bdellovibrionota bacterium]